MKILLVGEYSNVHWSLAEGLRALGHEVTVVSNGDYWKQYPCDIKLERLQGGRSEALKYYSKVRMIFQKLKGYDVVQLINPMFLELKAERIEPFYRQLQRNNGKIFLAAYGMDHYYVKACLENHFTYSEFMVDGKLRDIIDNRAAIEDWMKGQKAPLNRMIADECNGIIAGLWEYYESYRGLFPTKSTYIPFPVPLSKPAERFMEKPDGQLRLFLGVQRNRSQFKGTDILLPMLQELEQRYPDKCRLMVVENVPFDEYRRVMRTSDILVDQLYSPTPNMNSLLAMSQGLAVAGGGELEPYGIIGEDKLHPVINLPCREDKVREVFEELLYEEPDSLQQRKADSIEYVKKHHDPKAVAQQYIEFWQSR